MTQQYIDFSFESPVADGTKIHASLYSPSPGAPKASVIIIPGMGDHGGRYQHVAKALVNANFSCVLYDQRGYGRTGRNNEQLGSFAEQDGWFALVKDVNQIVDNLKLQYGNDHPIFIIGHSMGSFVLQTYLIQFGHRLQGAILEASTIPFPGYLVNIKSFLLKGMEKKHGTEQSGHKVHKILLGPKDRRSRLKSSDPEQIEAFIQDELAGTMLDSNGWHDVLTGMKFNRNMANVYKIPKTLPILMLSGKLDMLSLCGFGVKRLVGLYKKCGLKDVDYQLFSGEGHELFHGKIRDEIIQTVIDWFNLKLEPVANQL